MPFSIPGWITSLVYEFCFDRAKAAFHQGVIQQFPSGSWIGSSRLHQGAYGNHQQHIGILTVRMMQNTRLWPVQDERPLQGRKRQPSVVQI
jgi:hypothetical protein